MPIFVDPEVDSGVDQKDNLSYPYTDTKPPTAEPEAPTQPKRWLRAKIFSSVRENLRYFYLIVAIMTLLLVLFAPRTFVIINSGEVGVQYRLLMGGTRTEYVYPEGLRVILPWNEMFIYSIRVQEAKDEVSVLTKEGLVVKLKISVRFHPDESLVGLLHKEIGPNYKDRLVLPEVESALRENVAQTNLEDFYESESGFMQRIINQSSERVSAKYVTLDSVILREVELPPRVQAAVEEKMMQQQQLRAYEFRIKRELQEADRRKIEATSLAEYNGILGSSLKNPDLLKYKGLEVTRELANSPNTKTVIVGTSGASLPILFGSEK